MPSLREALQNLSAVVVTGGSSGIGKSFIELMAKLNPDLHFCNLSRSEPRLNFDQLKLRHIACDLSDPAAIDGAVAGVLAHLEHSAPAGRVLLINNSGFGHYGNFPDSGLPGQLDMIDVNSRAVVHLTGALLPLLKRRGGAIVTIASTAAFQPTPYLAVYGATKAFVLHWSLALNEELRGTSVRSLVVCPGPTATNFFRRAGLVEGTVPDSLSMTCEAVVMQSLRALARGRSQVVTGWKNKLTAAAGSTLPPAMSARVAKVVIGRHRMSRVTGNHGGTA